MNPLLRLLRLVRLLRLLRHRRLLRIRTVVSLPLARVVSAPPLLFGLLACVAGCGGPAVCTDATQACALESTKRFVQENLDGLAAATAALCDAAPAPDSDGWNADRDAAAVETMRNAWRRARASYEHVEGAIAVLFPELDVAIDERYEGFVEGARDGDLFDGEGVIGMHAIERILWATSHPASVVAFERSLGEKFVAAAFPANETEARDFSTKLCARLEADTRKMRDDFAPLALDAPAAFRGVIGSMQEQVEKLTHAASGEEESRYAQYTLADLRANLEGGEHTFEAFARHLAAADGGPALVTATRTAFDRLEQLYARYPGDALPAPPATWSALQPSAADLETPFGRLFQAVSHEADATREGSLVEVLTRGADAMRIPQIGR